MSLDREHFKIQDKDVILALGDKVPSEIKKLSLGGNGTNAAVGLTRLEVPTSFYTFLGGDILSREIEQTLSSEGVALKAQKDDGKTSLSLIFDFDTDRIIFSHHEKREHRFRLSDQDFDYIYLHSIGDPWQDCYKQILEYANNYHIPIAFSPGSHQIEAEGDTFMDTIKSSKIFFSNRQEAEKILNTKYEIQNTKELLMAVKTLGPQIVSITDGAAGAYAVDAKDDYYFIKPSPKDGVEKTGAGDSYASAFLAGVLHGEDLPTAMKWGVLNAQSVMQQVGAQTGLLTKTQLDEEVKNNDNLSAEQI